MEPILFLSNKNGRTYEFWLIYEKVFHKNVGAYVYRVFIRDEQDCLLEEHLKFSVLFKIMANRKELKLIDLYPSNHYRGKGISIALILEAKKIFKKRIISSSKDKPTFHGEDRWEDATNKVWLRLVKNGLAAYDARRDVYFTL